MYNTIQAVSAVIKYISFENEILSLVLLRMFLVRYKEAKVNPAPKQLNTIAMFFEDSLKLLTRIVAAAAYNSK